MIRITPSILSIPPYISTQWSEVRAIQQTSSDTLLISLMHAGNITIPNLSAEIIASIFEQHQKAAETSPNPSDYVTRQDLNNFLHILQGGMKEIVALILKLGASAISSVGKALAHDPANAHLPMISEEMKNKIIMLLTIVPKEDILAMPSPEPHCNCMYCQISRTLREAIGENVHIPENMQQGSQAEEEVGSEELSFSEWVVIPVSEKIFIVRSKLDQHEEYRVHLGNPIGCTCGKANCEHIVAVLRS